MTASRPRTRVEGIRVRSMTETDLTAVMEIEREAFTIPWTLATFTGLLRRENTRLWVAEAVSGPGAAELAGYAAVWMVADQAELGDLAVAGRWRRHGVGSDLLDVVLREMAVVGVRELFLEVRESNREAQRLYARHGFTEVGRRRGYYTRPREDALVLRRLVEPVGPPTRRDELQQ